MEVAIDTADETLFKIITALHAISRLTVDKRLLIFAQRRMKNFDAEVSTQHVKTTLLTINIERFPHQLGNINPLRGDRSRLVL